LRATGLQQEAQVLSRIVGCVRGQQSQQSAPVARAAVGHKRRGWDSDTAERRVLLARPAAFHRGG
jgi:hypothetical protein